MKGTPPHPRLILYTIYERPKDFPDKFVVRAWEIGRAPCPGKATAFNTLEEARSAVPRGLYCLHRHPTDEPAIVESWI